MLFFQKNLFRILIILFYISILIKKLSFTKKKSNNQKYKIFNIIKNKLHYIINGNLKKNISYIDSLYIIGKYKFGNFIICLNKAILFCELFFCKRIIIQSNQNIFIFSLLTIKYVCLSFAK